MLRTQRKKEAISRACQGVPHANFVADDAERWGHLEKVNVTGDNMTMQASTTSRQSASSVRPTVLALDLEATLISSAVSQFPRPGLFDFLNRCRELFARIVMFTTVPEVRFRQIAATLALEGAAPAWFQEVEYVNWVGSTKNLEFIPDCDVIEAMLVDDLESYVHPGQASQWIKVEPFEPPFDDSDTGLASVLVELEMRAKPN